MHGHGKEARGDASGKHDSLRLGGRSPDSAYALTGAGTPSSARGRGIGADFPHAHSHVHGIVDRSLVATQRGMWAVKWSLLALIATAVAQAFVAYLSGSVALFADTVHNLGDAATAIPLAIAFALGRRGPTKRFTYGYGRVEDLAGVAVVLTILFSAVVAGYWAIERFFHPQGVDHLWAVMVASLVGFLGNEGVALFRIRVGKEIGSAALIADGHHARVDGLTSLAVLAGMIGVSLGYPLADPITGLIISIVILRVVWGSAKMIFTRLIDGVDPEVVDDIKRTATNTEGVHDVSEVRVRWLGHRLHAELNIAVDANLSVCRGHDTAVAVQHELLHHLRHLATATVHIDPAHASGEEHHGAKEGEREHSPVHRH